MRKRATIVTGASRGIGRAIALRMAKTTAVVPVARTREDLESLCEEIQAAGGEAAYAFGDVTDPDTAKSAYVQCMEHGWDVHNLVLNAGFGKSGLIHEMDDALWESIMDINVIGTQRFLKACLPWMLAQKKGNVCLMSSVSGLVGSRLNTAYVASKHALVGLAKSMAKDYGADGIVTVAICPGYVETDMTERSIQKRMDLKGLTREEARQKIVEINPQRRIIPPEEIAEAVAWVCSGKCPSISGSALVLSGGA